MEKFENALRENALTKRKKKKNIKARKTTVLYDTYIIFEILKNTNYSQKQINVLKTIKTLLKLKIK